MLKTEWLSRHRLKLLMAVSAALVLLNVCSSPPNTVVQTTRIGATPEAPTARSTLPVSPADFALTMVAPTPRPALEAASRNPFVLPAVVVSKPPAPLAVVVVPPSEPPRPTAPPLNTEFAGQMTTPDGRTLVYVTQGDSTVVLEPGLTLPNGYQVDKISATAIDFLHPAFNSMARLAIPPAAKYETR